MSSKDDFISRSALIEDIKRRKYINKPLAEIFETIIDEQPTVDAVPVVRCKDCSQWGCGVPGETDFVKCCKYANYMVGANGFCVCGEEIIWNLLNFADRENGCV